jgi:S1-C subfamily serine protease
MKTRILSLNFAFPSALLAMTGLLSVANLQAQPAAQQTSALQQTSAAQLTSADVPSPTSLAELKAVNERVKALAAKVRPAVVQVSGGSGVVVSADGLVMSVAHVGSRAGRRVTFTFPDGRRANGVTLGNDKMGDAGLMRITDPGKWPHAILPSLKTSGLGSGASP